jgi:FAD:protein FMN transferase
MKLNLNKGNIYALVLLLAMFAVYYYRTNIKAKEHTFKGDTMGTTYTVKYISKEQKVTQQSIDSLLVVFNNVFSTYIPSSEISRFNKEGQINNISEWFYLCLAKSKEVYDYSAGAFDPTVMPLVNAWGFGFKNLENIDSLTIDSIMPYVGFNKIEFTEKIIKRVNEGSMLDLSAISKGYGVDIVAEMLEKNNIEHYLVEIGGEVRVKGKNIEEKRWTIGIDNPSENGDIIQKISLEDESLATSGNYRNYYIKDGKRYAHTINPKTGFPAENELLSASVIAKTCMEADAYATAFMVMGKNESIDLAKKLNLKIMLIYSDKEGNSTIFKNF